MIPSISDALEVVVADSAATLAANPDINFGSLPKEIYWMHGHPKEILARLVELTKSPEMKNMKYPLFALFRDFKEKVDEVGPNLFSVKARPRLIIATLTEPSYRAEQRKQMNFDPILHPILETFLNTLRLSSDFGMPTIKSLNLEIWDRYFWGTTPAGEDEISLNDYIDAVEIEGISLELKKYCPPNGLQL